MENKNYRKEKPSIFDMERPEFPKRAVITGGMPYGNKKLHFGHRYCRSHTSWSSG